MQSSITKAPFGRLPDGRPATLYTLTNRNGIILKITDFGGIITALHTPDRDGNMADIVLGYDSVEPYLDDGTYFGALIGRYGNRVREGRFTLDGRVVQLPLNHGRHHLHGGLDGFHRVLWQVLPFQDSDAVGLALMRRSADGEQGYPGNLDVTVVYALNGEDELVITFDAVSDKATPVNLTQHAYFNLAGGGDILAHQLVIDADAYTPVDAALIPTGEIAPVAGTPFDFRTPHPIGERIHDAHPQLDFGRGYDHNFVLNKPAGRGATLAARLQHAASGRVLELHTQEPGVQFYSGNFLDGSLCGKGRTYGLRSGLCLEPQHFPDSPNQPTFPNTILRPGEEYATVSKYKFYVGK